MGYCILLASFQYQTSWTFLDRFVCSEKISRRFVIFFWYPLLKKKVVFLLLCTKQDTYTKKLIKKFIWFSFLIWSSFFLFYVFITAGECHLEWTATLWWLEIMTTSVVFQTSPCTLLCRAKTIVKKRIVKIHFIS